MEFEIYDYEPGQLFDEFIESLQEQEELKTYGLH